MQPVPLLNFSPVLLTILSLHSSTEQPSGCIAVTYDTSRELWLAEVIIEGVASQSQPVRILSMKIVSFREGRALRA
jgi:hypothetical protein